MKCNDCLHYEVCVKFGITVDFDVDGGVCLEFAKDNNVPSKWIPVTERLPEEWNRVLVYIPHIDVMTFAKLRSGSWYATWDSTKLDHVSHWMPLPEPPKGE